MKSQPPLHKCAQCDGSGQVPLTPPLFAALQKVPAKGARDVLKIAAGLGITEQAANARMVVLVKHGFVARSKDGKKYLYSRVP